jgi:hypothetical protein
MHFTRFRLLCPRGDGVSMVSREGVVEYDNAYPGDAILRIMRSLAPYPGDLLELEFDTSYGYVKFKWTDATCTKIEADGSIIYERKV